jgi:hypothetical protein
MYKLNIGKKGLLLAAEMEKGSVLAAGYTERPNEEYQIDRSRFLDFMSNILLKEPVSGEKMVVEGISGHEKGLDHLEIITSCEGSRWKTRIYQEEIPFEDEN